MPIRLNLLAEAQQLEDLRRRDPVKRAVWGGAILVVAVLVWSSTLWAKVLVRKFEVSRIEAAINSKKTDFTRISESQKELREIRGKLTSLQLLTTNRFLNGNVLQTLQQATIENVHLTRIKVEQTYTLNEAVKPQTNSGRLVPGIPASVTDKVVLTVDARDVGANPGDSVTPYRETLAARTYFQKMLGKTNEVRLKDLRARDATPEGQDFVAFALEFQYPEKRR